MSLTNFGIYKELFNTEITDLISNYDTKTKEMLFYALDGGKRLRPIICLDICNSLTHDYRIAVKFALAIECIHTASLLIDDLPCMDNDNYRRNKLAFHIKYSVTDAQLIASQLINTSLQLIYENCRHKPNKLIYIFNNICKNVGILGATGGQFMDITPNIYKNKKQLLANFKNKENMKILFKKKTSSIFEMAFIGGYILGDGDFKNIDKIKQAAEYFGIAFQIYDDFNDIDQDLNRVFDNLIDINFINNHGIDESNKEFLTSLNIFKTKMHELGLFSKTSNELYNYLKYKVESKIKNLYSNHNEQQLSC